jgi:L-threonylcarbamoyladenylate synthase
MQIIKINPKKIKPEQINLIVDFLKRGKVIAYPTDTIYGLGCDAGNEKAIRKIVKIKNKEKKAILVLISDFKMLKRYCVVNINQEKYLKKIWFTRRSFSEGGHKPVTVILKKRLNLPDILTAGQETLAVRLPASEFLIRMISMFGRPVVSTSLNKTGEKPLNNVKNLSKYFNVLPDLVIDAGKCGNTKPSRLIDLRDVKNIKVLRK